MGKGFPVKVPVAFSGNQPIFLQVPLRFPSYFYGCMCYPFADIPVEITSVCFIFCRLDYLGLESYLQVAPSEHAELTVTCHCNKRTLVLLVTLNFEKGVLC